MVLVGKVNKDIVLRLNRHGQPAVGLCGDDGLLFRVARQAGAGRRGHRLRRARSSASTSTCSTTSPQDYIPVIASVGADRDGQLLQRQRRRGRGRRRARARRLQGDLPHRRRRAGCATRPTRQRRSREAGADEVEAALDGDRRRHAPEARRPASTRSTAASRSRTSSTGACRTRCCSSCSPTPGIGTKIRPRHEPRRAAGARARRTSIATYARYPVEFVRGEGARLWDAEGNEYLDFLAGISVVAASATATRRVVAAVREQAGRLMHVGNLFYTEPAMRLAAAAGRVARSAARCSSATRAPRPTRRRSSSRARRSRGGDDRRRSHGGFHGRTYGALSATPQESKQAPFAPLVPGLRRGRADRRGARARRSTSDTAAVLLEPIQGESGRLRRSPTSCCARRARPATRTARR